MLLSKELSVGNRLLDSEHKNLHDIINVITSLIVAGDVAALLEAFELLENCLCAYFVVEENVAQAANFDFTQHMLAHQGLFGKFQRIKHEWLAKNGMWSELENGCFIHSLRDCLIQHIKVDSRPFQMVLNTCLYDLKPNCAGGDYLH